MALERTTREHNVSADRSGGAVIIKLTQKSIISLQ